MSYSVKINCGGGAVGEWLADTGFAGGSTRSTTNTPSLAGLTNPAPLAVYQSARGDTGAGFSFTFSGLTVGKAYIVRLHFYEFEYANTNFRIGGVTKFSKDSSAGAAIGEFSFTASTASVTIECAIKDYQAWINGIELFAEPPPSDVTDLTAQAVSATHINLNWSPATDNIGVAQYRIERATNESFTQNLVSLDTGSTATSRAVTGLSADTHYYFRVKAIDADGNLSANWSNAATAVTKPDFLLFPLEMTKLSQSPEYFTTITEGKSGREQRNANWDAPLRSYNAMFAVKTQHDIDIIIAFFHAVKGRFKEFYLKDWTEYKYDFTACAEGGNGSRTEFQMSKTYTDVLGNITRRNIKKPRKGTVAVRVGGILQTEGTHYTVNYATGKITFNSAPANGAVVEQKCEFYVPVRFDTDKMPPAELFIHWINASDAEKALYNLADFPMVEVR